MARSNWKRMGETISERMTDSRHYGDIKEKTLRLFSSSIHVRILCQGSRHDQQKEIGQEDEVESSTLSRGGVVSGASQVRGYLIVLANPISLAVQVTPHSTRVPMKCLGIAVHPLPLGECQDSIPSVMPGWREHVPP